MARLAFVATLNSRVRLRVLGACAMFDRPEVRRRSIVIGARVPYRNAPTIRYGGRAGRRGLPGPAGLEEAKLGPPAADEGVPRCAGGERGLPGGRAGCLAVKSGRCLEILNTLGIRGVAEVVQCVLVSRSS